MATQTRSLPRPCCHNGSLFVSEQPTPAPDDVLDQLEPEVRQALCVEKAPDTETLLRLLDGLREA